MEVRWAWTPPAVDAEHGPAAGYQLESNHDGEGWALAADVPDTTVLLELLDGTTVVRVRAWNMDGMGERQYGPYSVSSDPISIGPPPGGCGTPIASRP